MPTLYIADVERDVGMKNLSRKEAAKILEGMKVKIEIPKAAVMQWERNTALDMAIEALKYSEIPNSSYCISRQAAIDELEERLQANGYSDIRLVSELNRSIGYIMRLPSAQTEPQWIPCSERLPEAEKEVFVYLFTDRPYIAWIDDLGIWRTNDFIVDKEDEPKAWMSPPEPYIEDDTDYDYERAVDQLEHDIRWEHTFNPDDGSM